MNVMKKKQISRILLSAAVVFTLFLSTSTALAEPDPLPKPLSPKGEITDRTPTYKWKPIPFGTKYRFQVTKDGSVVYTKNVDKTACSGTKCTFTPTDMLAYGEHKWRVRGYTDGSWGDYSTKKVFDVVEQPPGFDSQFTSDADGWKQILGQWNVKNSKYTTKGKPSKAASVSHSGEYLNFTYSARMKREGCAVCANALYIRGAPKPLGSSGDWNTHYQFQYTNDSRFSVYKRVSGTLTTLKGWTTTGVINSNDWNKLKVVAEGKKLKFYINNNLMWKGNDTSLTKGLVGLRMHRDASSSGNKLLVDWAMLELPDG